MCLEDSSDLHSADTKYEPIFETPRSKEFLQHIVLYECQGAGAELVTLSRRGAHVCNNHNNPLVPCNAVVAVWSRGSQVSRRQTGDRNAPNPRPDEND